MKEVDFEKIDQTIDEFEQVVDALDQIAIISERTAKTSEKINGLCSMLESTSRQVVENSDSVKTSLTKFDKDFQTSAESLLSVKDTIISSNEKVSEAIIDLAKQDSDSQKKLAELFRDESAIIRSAEDAANRRVETQLGIITDRLSLLQTMKADLEVIKAQLAANRKIAIAGTVAAAIAMVASIVGLFV